MFISLSMVTFLICGLLYVLFLVFMLSMFQVQVGAYGRTPLQVDLMRGCSSVAFEFYDVNACGRIHGKCGSV